MSGAPRPPALARRLLVRAAHRLGTPELVDDAAELFEERASHLGAASARRWYRRQAVAALTRALAGGRRAVCRPERAGWSGGFSLDAKLGMRMLARYPGLTVVGGLAMAFALVIGVGTFQFVRQMVDPALPLPEGDRIVGLRYWDRAENDPVLPVAEDVRSWREALATVRDIGGFRELERNISVANEVGEPLRVARMSAAGFRVAGVRPLLGRVLVEGDEEPGAAEVVVLGHAVWQATFGGDPGVTGRPVRLGEIPATVVGVMPEGFGFPRDAQVWAPLRLGDTAGEGIAEAPIRVFGRLAPGASIDEANAEAAALAARSERFDPILRDRPVVQVLPYVHSLYSFSVGLLLRAMIYQINVYATLFLILVAANVALLMFARATTREREILLRNALGASRGRIVLQLFVEALILASLATALGLAATAPVLRWVYDRLRDLGGDLPFWLQQPVLSPTTAAWAALLTLLAALVAGVLPALKVTGPGMHARLRQVGSGAGGLRFGGIWTAIIITQIAATVVFSGVALVVARQAVRSASVETYFPAGQYLGVRIEMDRGSAAAGADTTRAVFLDRYGAHLLELKRRVAELPGVTGVALAERLPVKAHASAVIELDAGEGARLEPGRSGHTIFAGAVDLDFFDALGAPVLSGRGFDGRDLTAGVNVVVVNASFVDEVLGGRNPIGQRIRYLDEGTREEVGPWYEIVGVVRDLVADRTRSLDLEDPPRARLYHPLDAARPASYPLHLVAHVPAGPASLGAILPRAAASVSPALRLHEPITLDRANSDLTLLWQLWARLVTLASGVALVLSLAGIYAVLSFTVARRTREIGIRVALGARASRVIADIFRTPLIQVGAGVAAGCLIVAGIVWGLTQGRASIIDGALLLVFGLAMLGVCGVACVGPTVRALRVDPARAMSAED